MGSNAVPFPSGREVWFGIMGSMTEEVERLQSLWAEGNVEQSQVGWPKKVCGGCSSPGRAQSRRRQESGVRERGTGPAFMLLCECLRAWREPLRMAALCRTLLLHAQPREVMRWGVIVFPQHFLFISLCCGFDPLTLSASLGVTGVLRKAHLVAGVGRLVQSSAGVMWSPQ